MSANRDNVDRICVSSVGCGSLLRSHTYAYDGWNLILEQIAHAGGSTDVIEYFWGYDLSGSEQGAGGVGGLVALAINGAFYFPCYDQNGNVTEYVDESGSIAAQFAYDAFGNLLTTENSQLATLLSLRFSTKYLDPETGFYYYGYRYYDPELGRWLTRDPLEEQGGLNLYGFCGNDAVNKWDKLGLEGLGKFVNIIVKRAKYKKQWYKIVSGDPYIYKELSPPETLRRKENCGKLYSVEYQIEPAGGLDTFNTIGDPSDPYRLWDGRQVKTNIGPPRNEFRYTVDVIFESAGKKDIVEKLWVLLPNMDGKWTWDTIASRTVIEPITTGTLNLTVKVRLRVLSDNRTGMLGIDNEKDVYTVTEDKYEIAD
jgi:RHS repeat-associated protein